MPKNMIQVRTEQEGQSAVVPVAASPNDLSIEHVGYFGVLSDAEAKSSLRFHLASDIDRLKAWANKAATQDKAEGLPKEETNAPKLASSEAPKKDEGEIEPEDELRSNFQRIVDVALSLSQLASVSKSARGLFPWITAQGAIVDPIRELAEPVLVDGELTVYGLSADRLFQTNRTLQKLDRMQRGLDLLPSAILLSVVATTDSLVSDLIRSMLRLKPGKLDSSEKTMPVSEIFKAGSFKELRESLIDDEIYKFSRGSHIDQAVNIQKWFNVKVRGEWKRWPDYIEVFERRNLLAHGERRFTRRYVQICTDEGHKGSDQLLAATIEVTPAYLTQTINVLMEFSILTLFSIWRKQFPQLEEQSFEQLNEACFRLISESRYQIPVRVIEYALSLKAVSMTAITRMMLTVNLASAHKHLNNPEACLSTLETEDWSAVADKFLICVESLKENVDLVVSLMPSVVASKQLKKEDFRMWPVFSFIRSDRKFQEAFSQQFEENLFDPSMKAKDMQQNEVADLEDD